MQQVNTANRINPAAHERAEPPCPAPNRSSPEDKLNSLLHSISELAQTARDARVAQIVAADYDTPAALMSARNFAAYLGIRRSDIRDLQRDLHRLGISSLGRMETHALDSIQSARNLLAMLAKHTPENAGHEPPDYDEGEQILSQRTAALLGPHPKHRAARIMVTMPTEAAAHYSLVRDLVASGMEVMRINCAHDDATLWRAMIANLRRAAAELGKHCAVLCDLAGPKLRTGALEHGPGVIRWRAFKDAYGTIVEPARIWLTAGQSPPRFAHATLPVDAAFVASLEIGDEIHFHDFQGRKRWIVVVERSEGGVWAESARGAYMVAGIPLGVRRGGADIPLQGIVGTLSPMAKEISLKVGEVLTLTRTNPFTTEAANCDDESNNPRIPCTLDEAFDSVRKGERVFLDDGKIAGVIEHADARRIDVRITWTRSETAHLSEEKGINLPDTPLRLRALTQQDLDALDFIAANRDQIDIVGLSFVRGADDVQSLYRELDRRELHAIGIVLKIETRRAFENLPGIILAALRRNVVGVMIARGDLGVEVGFERMAELQEEIASLCAAAHLPVVWATQVLESLAKRGMPSRAEVSDVVMAARTQCVMLNKGPHIVRAVQFLADVLERMEGHQDKHFRLLRALHVAQPTGA